MGLESMMRKLFVARNEKRDKQKQTKPCTESKDPNRVFLKTMVHNFLQSDSSLCRYDKKEMLDLLNQLKAAVAAEPTLLELESPVLVCGDIHGQLTDLRRIFVACGFPSCKRYLFLGDYVDRGEHSVEVVCTLAAWKLLFPANVFLIRGNHELAHINRDYGFYDEIMSKFIDPKDGVKVYEKFNEVFSYLPLAAVISAKILCMHGGISPSLNSLDDMRNLKRPIVMPKGLAQDMLWADPTHAVEGFKPNSLRGVSVNFGEQEVKARLKRLGVSKMIRAHQVVPNGWEVFAGGAVITVFSACRYQDGTNSAAVINVKKNLGLGMVMIKPSEADEKSGVATEPLTVDASAVKQQEEQLEKTMPSYHG